MDRRRWLRHGIALTSAMVSRVAFPGEAADPFGSLQWPDLKREFFDDGPVTFDDRVQVRAPAFAEDPMNVPVTVSADALPGVRMLLVFVDRNPIRKVLEVEPVAAHPRVSFRFKLEQASPVRAAARTADGRWHLGGAWVDSAGGGCTVPGATRSDGSWSRTLGDLSARVFPQSDASTRVRLRVMHPMDTGLVAGIPAFHLQRLSLLDAAGRELLRLRAFEPVSENPVFSFDFAELAPGALRLVASDNNGNRFDGPVPR